VPDSELLSSYDDPERSPAWINELVRRLTQPTCPVDLYHESYNELKRLVPDHPLLCPLHEDYVRQQMRPVHRASSLIPIGNPLHEALYGEAPVPLAYSQNSSGETGLFAPNCNGCQMDIRRR
jgi:hypothetical protein